MILMGDKKATDLFDAVWHVEDGLVRLNGTLFSYSRKLDEISGRLDEMARRLDALEGAAGGDGLTADERIQLGINNIMAFDGRPRRGGGR